MPITAQELLAAFNNNGIDTVPKVNACLVLLRQITRRRELRQQEADLRNTHTTKVQEFNAGLQAIQTELTEIGDI